MPFLLSVLDSALVGVPFAFLFASASFWLFRKLHLQGWRGYAVVILVAGLAEGIISAAVVLMIPHSWTTVRDGARLGIQLGITFGALAALLPYQKKRNPAP